MSHYACLSVPRSATKAQIKTSYYQLSKIYHPDIAKDDASQSKFHALSEAYAILGDDRKRREYDRSLGSPFRASHASAQHPQATTSRPAQHHASNHPWPTHPRARSRDRHDHLYEHSASRPDPFMNPSVQRSTGYRRSTPGSHPSNARANPPPDAFQNAGHSSWMAEARRPSTSDGRPTQDQAAAESGILRALGASGLVGIIMLVAAITCNSRPA